MNQLPCAVCGRMYDPTLEVQCKCGYEHGTPIPGAPRPPDPPASPAHPVDHGTPEPRVAPTPPPAPAAASRLVITVCGHDFPIEEDEPVGLGRDLHFGAIADALADAGNVSRMHAMLRFSGGRIYVQDTDSANGTFIDDVRIPAGSEYEIADGQSLRLAADVPIRLRKES